MIYYVSLVFTYWYAAPPPSPFNLHPPFQSDHKNEVSQMFIIFWNIWILFITQGQT